MEATTRELAAVLPWGMQQSVGYSIDIANDLLFDVLLERGESGRLDDLRELVEIVFLLRLVKGYLVTGFVNLSRLFSYLSSKEIEGFEMGSRVFGPNESFTTNWSQASDAFEDLLANTPLGRFVLSSDRDIQIVWSIAEATR